MVGCGQGHRIFISMAKYATTLIERCNQHALKLRPDVGTPREDLLLIPQRERLQEPGLMEGVAAPSFVMAALWLARQSSPRRSQLGHPLARQMSRSGRLKIFNSLGW
jgi:hypothetical protein